jgi:hypothetical protein
MFMKRNEFDVLPPRPQADKGARRRRLPGRTARAAAAVR